MSRHGSVMAGQSVGMVTAEQPTAEIIAELVDQAARRAGAPRGAERLRLTRMPAPAPPAGPAAAT